MFDEPRRRHRYDNGMYRHDTLFPLRSKFVERPDMLGTEVEDTQEIKPLDPQVELIARTSYKLGHAEANAMHGWDRAHRAEERLESKTTELKEVRDSKNYYERKFEESDKANDELIAKVDKLEKKLKPKKVAKNVQRRPRSKNK